MLDDTLHRAVHPLRAHWSGPGVMGKDTSYSSSSLPRATLNFLPKHWSEESAGRLTSSFNLMAAAHPVYFTNILIKLNVRKAVHGEGCAEKTNVRVVVLCRSAEIWELSTWRGLHSQQGAADAMWASAHQSEESWGKQRARRGKVGLKKNRRLTALKIWLCF